MLDHSLLPLTFLLAYQYNGLLHGQQECAQGDTQALPLPGSAEALPKHSRIWQYRGKLKLCDIKRPSVVCLWIEEWTWKMKNKVMRINSASFGKVIQMLHTGLLNSFKHFWLFVSESQFLLFLFFFSFVCFFISLNCYGMTSRLISLFRYLRRHQGLSKKKREWNLKILGHLLSEENPPVYESSKEGELINHS